MVKNFFSISDLLTFCKTKNYTHFSAKESGSSIKIRTTGMFEVSEENNEQALGISLKSCHIGRNLNSSLISKENMERCKTSFKGKPILGAFVYDEEAKEWDFNGHDMEIVEDEEGNQHINYIEQIIGNISETEDPYLSYDEDQDKEYLMVKGKIFEEYTKAADIVRRRKSCACSVELLVNELSYSTSEDCIELEDFVFSGVTLLGEKVKPGMAGSKITIDTFAQNDTVVEYQDKLLNMLERLNNTLSTFSDINSKEKKGGEKMDKFHELLAAYNKTEADITFEIEGLSDIELEDKFKEVFEENDEKDDGASTSEVEEGPEDGATVDTENETYSNKKKKCSIDENGDMTVEFSISHEEIRQALYSLLMTVEEENNDYYYIRSVYDENFIYEGWCTGKIYRQTYTKDGDNISLGDRTEVFEIIVTAEEKDALEKLKGNYAALETQYNELKAFKDNYDAAQLKAQKDEIFAKAEYADLVDTDGFKTLVADAEKYSVEEIGVKCDLLFAAHVKAVGTFSAKEPEKKKPKVIGVNFNIDTNKKSKPYGNLFGDK